MNQKEGRRGLLLALWPMNWSVQITFGCLHLGNHCRFHLSSLPTFSLKTIVNTVCGQVSNFHWIHFTMRVWQSIFNIYFPNSSNLSYQLNPIALATHFASQATWNNHNNHYFRNTKFNFQMKSSLIWFVLIWFPVSPINRASVLG